MNKKANEIIKWGKIKPYYDDKAYKFNTLDLETIKNELFLFGYILDNKYKYCLNNFYNTFNDFLIDSARKNYHILTWSRYDNVHILKLILRGFKHSERELIFKRIGKISPILHYEYNGLTISLDNVIKYSLIFTITDKIGRKKTIIIYNLKNLFTTDLEQTAKNYQINDYSKLGKEYHIINKERFFDELEYRQMVIKSNYLDNKVLIDIATKFLTNFKEISGIYPKTIFTAGSIARSFLLAFKDDMGGASELSFKTLFKDLDKDTFNMLLDYSMCAYHGGKVETYTIGYIKEGYITDKNSAYPYALSILPKIIPKIHQGTNSNEINNYFYAFIKCNINIDNPNFIHPIIVNAPTNNINVSPWGYLKNVIITKWEYDYLRNNNIDVEIINYIALEHDNNVKPYNNLVMSLINGRYTSTNKSKADLFKTIVNSLYGISFELTPLYKEIDNNIVLQGYRAGDYFNSIIASYITAITRTDLSNIDNNIIKNGGEIYFNMTDSILYNGVISFDIFSNTKILGKYSVPEYVRDIYILGTGRYEYKIMNKKYFIKHKNVYICKYIVKNRGFIARRKNRGFYSRMKLTENIKIKIDTFITIFKSTTSNYDFDVLGHIMEDDYNIQPFNLGGKRFCKDITINLNKERTDTIPYYYEKDY